jgi:HK97 family phage prohead protease
MPYEIQMDNKDCQGHAVVKLDDGFIMGCHKTHEEAEKQLQAILINEAKQKEEKSTDQDVEKREVDRKPPKFMQTNAQRGLDNLNKAGDGLTDKTKREARSMANGEDVSIDKIVRMGAWHKRHLSDLDREASNPNDPDTWRASDVAFLLWGSNPWTNPTQAGDWADRKIAQLVSDGKLEPRTKNKKDVKVEKQKKKRYKLMDKIDKVVAISQTIDMQKRNTILKEMDRQTENRSFTFSAVEQRNDDDKDTLLFTGYASVFNKGYGVRDQRGQYTETIKPGAFKKTLQEQDDVRFLVNHDGIPLARTSSGTLELEEDDYGLFVKAELDPSNPTVAEIASAMKRGDLNEMSFAFAAIRDDFDAREENREVTEARLFDVSVVTYPANPWAGAKLRGVELDNLHKELVEARNGEQATEVLESFINKVAESDDVDKKRSNPKVELLKMQLERDNIRK